MPGSKYTREGLAAMAKKEVHGNLMYTDGSVHGATVQVRSACNVYSLL